MKKSMWSEPVSHNIFYMRFNNLEKLLNCVGHCAHKSKMILDLE